ncbi:MAG: cellulase-like family protein [Bryobacterales bacterium]|nr:cellulase-like family protein [Bryobacterales bacterium]
MLDRRSLLLAASAPFAGSSALSQPSVSDAPRRSLARHIAGRPLAITMWDFSWLERRWPGAGYEDWDQALSELKLRGYDAVRIDAYPHLIAAGAEKRWELKPQWNQQDWGAPALCRVQVQPALNDFLRACSRNGIKAGLSTWYREETPAVTRKYRSGAEQGEDWKRTLDRVAGDGLLEGLLYVDLCNEFPLDVWCPWFPKGFRRNSPEGARWMRDAIAVCRDAYPQLDYCFSFTSEYDRWKTEDVGMHDFLELHVWMTHFTDFYKQVGYHYERFDSKGYENLVANAEALYRSKPEYWNGKLADGVRWAADWSRAAKKPLITTECWGVVDYKDWPLLNWNWVKDLCETGVRAAASTGCWAAIATSNFCGPQFTGMWRDIEWHRRMTKLIHEAKLPPL